MILFRLPSSNIRLIFFSNTQTRICITDLIFVFRFYIWVIAWAKRKMSSYLSTFNYEIERKTIYSDRWSHIGRYQTYSCVLGLVQYKDAISPVQEFPLLSLDDLIWGLRCEKQVYQAGISNYITLFTVVCNYLSLPETPASGKKVHI